MLDSDTKRRIDPARDIVTGANRHLFGLNTGVSMTDARGRGVGLCPMDYPLVSLDTSGCWRYSLDFVPPKKAEGDTPAEPAADDPVAASVREGRELFRAVLPPGEYLIGREGDVAILLPSEKVSRRHARLP